MRDRQEESGRQIRICPRGVVATAVTRVTGSGYTATGCITLYCTSKYTFGDARSRVKYIIYDVAGFGSNLTNGVIKHFNNNPS